MEHENEFLNVFFGHLSHLCFEKAKEHVEREKEAWKASALTPWSMLLTHLPQILLAEKSYIELGFLTIKNKGFLRKENSLRAIYDGLRIELKRLEEITKLSQSTDDSLVTTDKPISFYIAEFLTARIDLIDLYEKMHQLGFSKYIKYNNVITQIDAIKNKHSTTFAHIALTPMKAVVSLEMEILYYLLEALNELQALEFISSITNLYQAHSRLAVWENSLQNRESWKLGFSASFLKNNPQPLLFQWLVKLKSAALSKFSLYFHNTLLQQTTMQEMRQLCAKQQVDHYSKMVSFQRRYDMALVSLVYDNRGLEDISEKNIFSIIVCHPTKLVKPLIDNFMKLIIERSPDLTNIDKYAYLFNQQDNNTYIVANIEPRIHILLIVDGKRSEKDIYLSNFITELSYQLRFVKNFTSLKTSSK